MFRFHWLLPDGPHMVLSVIILALWKRIWSFCNSVEPFLTCESVFNRQTLLMRSDQGLDMASWISWENMDTLNCHISLFKYINLFISRCTENSRSSQAVNVFQAQTYRVGASA